LILVPTKVFGANPPLPPIEAIWNLAKFSISVEGVSTKDLKLEKNPRLPSSHRPHRRDDYPFQSYAQLSASIDSSFIFVVTRNRVTPLLAGCYAGNPPPPPSAFSIPCPEEIMKKPPPANVKRPKKPKLTETQKRVKKLRGKIFSKLKRGAEMFFDSL
ncbi:hypothetical protein OESDEN_13888, partial [Oesophagostomum dentatum]